MGQRINIDVDAENAIGQVVSALLLNAYYSAQMLHVSQGKPLDEGQRKSLLLDVIAEWGAFLEARAEIGEKQKAASS